MGKGTREKILRNALEMFANKGYEGTNIRELSDALGVSKGAMYRHYDSKEHLWDSVLNAVEVEYENHMEVKNDSPEIPETTDELVEMTLRMIDYTMHDPNVIMCRKMLNREQYRDEKVAILSDRRFLTDIEEKFTIIFKGMIEKNIFKDGDYKMMALEYSATIGALINQRDRFPNKEKEIVEKALNYIHYFIKNYAKN